MLRKNFTIGKYTTTSAEPIGVGSFASVYVARHVESSVSVAIKVVDLQRLKAINSKLMTHLQSEIDVMRGLRHRNIVRLFDIAMEEPNLYMVLEMCRFGDMSKYVQAQPTGRLDEQRARFFAMQLRDGLAFLHERRIIHRDLKPQNLLLAEPLRGTASDAFVLKIADFGFAREMREQMAETMCGSPLFMAVEILRGERYTESADLWSTGAILYYLLTGQPPFKADTAHQLHRMIESTAVSLPNDVRVSGDAAQLVYALLQKQPASRLSWQAFATHPWLTARPLPHDAAYHVIVQSDNNNNNNNNNSSSSSTGNSETMRSSEPPVSPTALHADARPFTAADHSPLRRRPRAATSPSLGIHPLPIANRRLTGVDLAASEFLTDAVVVMSEDELVHDIERRRDRANAVAEQARALLDSHPNNALMLYVAALVSLRDALQQASAAAIHLSARASHSPRDTGSSPIDSGQPIRVSIALGALRHAVRDVLRDGLGARDDVAASLRRSAEARPAIGVDSAPQIGLSGECAELIFKRAMSAGRAAAAAELEQVYGKSARLYLKGVLLLEFLLDSAHDETDKTVLNQYKSLFEQRLFVTETYNQ